MEKVTFGPKTLLYPMPAVLVGSLVDGRPTFTTVSWTGIVNSDPPMLSISLRPQRHTLAGILQNETFSVNVPSEALLRETDHCGTVSGAMEDKATTCGFTVFYGETPAAPLISQAPINLECRVVHRLDLGSHLMLVAEIVQSHVSASCFSDGKPDLDKIKPLAYAPGLRKEYRGLGKALAPAYTVKTL